MHGIPRPKADRVLLYLLCSVLLTTLDSARVAGGMPAIKRVAVQGTDDGIEVRITSSEPLAPQTQLLTGPDRIVVDFPGGVLAGHLRKLTVNQGGVKSVRTGQFESNPPTAARSTRPRCSHIASAIKGWSPLHASGVTR